MTTIIIASYSHHSQLEPGLETRTGNQDLTPNAEAVLPTPAPTDSSRDFCLLSPHHGGRGQPRGTDQFIGGQRPVSPGPWQERAVPSLPFGKSLAAGPGALLAPPPGCPDGPPTDTHTSPHALHVDCWGEYKLDKSPSNSSN